MLLFNNCPSLKEKSWTISETKVNFNRRLEHRLNGCYIKDITNQTDRKFVRIIRISRQKTPLPGFEPGTTGSNPDSGLTR